MTTRCRISVPMALAAATLACATSALADVGDSVPRDVMPVRLHIAYDADRAGMDAWIRAQLAQANRVLVCAGVRLEVVSWDVLVPRARALDDRAALAAASRSARDRHGVDVFVVRSVARAVSSHELIGLGVPPGRMEHGFVAIVRSPDPFVLAHEVGHFLGLTHVTDRANLMAPSAPAGHQLTPEQCRSMRTEVRARARTASANP